MKDFFKDLFKYTHLYNCQLIDILTNADNKLPEHAAKVFSHMLDAHKIWNTRVSGEGKSFGVWQLHPPAQYLEIAETNYKKSLHLIEQRHLDEMIVYTNSQGHEFRNTARDMLFQIINHSTYHRGQLATLCRENGIEPLMSEYIFYKR